VNAPSAAAVSRFLGDRFNRSQRVGRGPTGITAGFTVRQALGGELRPTDWVVVEFEPGYHTMSRFRFGEDSEGLLKYTQKVLTDYERNLKIRYDVSRNDEDEPDQWNCLIVRHKKTESEKD
jgi:hypothetical protein